MVVEEPGLKEVCGGLWEAATLLAVAVWELVVIRARGRVLVALHGRLVGGGGAAVVVLGLGAGLVCGVRMGRCQVEWASKECVCRA